MITRNKRSNDCINLKETLSQNLELWLQDFAQEYGEINYNDITRLSKCWDTLENSTKQRIRKFVSEIKKACKETGLDTYELSQEYPEDKENCDNLVRYIKNAINKENCEESYRSVYIKEGIETGEIVNDIQDCEYFIHILQKRLDEINNLNEQVRTTRRAVDIDSVVTKANKYSTDMALAVGKAMRQATLLQKELEDIVDKTDGNI